MINDSKFLDKNPVLLYFSSVPTWAFGLEIGAHRAFALRRYISTIEEKIMDAMFELALRRQFDEAKRQALADPARATIARVALQSIIDGKTEAEVRASIGMNRHTPKVDLAEERRAAIEANFRKRGFEISVPKPEISNKLLKLWRKQGREPFYRPPTAQMTYEAWMTAHGQTKHWTVANEAHRAKT